MINTTTDKVKHFPDWQAPMFEPSAGANNMTYLPTDILIRETSSGATVWLSERLILVKLSLGSDYVHLSRIRYTSSLPPSWKGVMRQDNFFLGDTGRGWRWGRHGGEFYYDYDRVPNRSPRFYRDALPPKEELVDWVDQLRIREGRARDTHIEHLIRSAVDSSYNNAEARWFQYDSGYQLSSKTSQDYAKALAWCRTITAALSSNSYQEWGFKTQALFLERIASIISRFSISNFRITTGESLRQKILTFPEDIEAQRRWIISGKHDNANRLIVGKYPIVDTETGEVVSFDVHQAVMYSVYMNPGGAEKEHIEALYWSQYVPTMQEFEVRPVALRTFKSHLRRLSRALSLELYRHGFDYWRSHIQTYIPSEKLSYAHSLFAGDGSATIAYKYWRKRENPHTGHISTQLRSMNLYLVMISDVASGYITGWGAAPEGAHSETLDMVQDAVRMSVVAGGNQTMFEFVSDNHSAFTSAESRHFLSNAFSRVRTIEVGNSQANPAETQFRLFKNTTLRSQRNFLRSSHNASVLNRANPDNLNIEELPYYEEVLEQLAERVEVWNNTPRNNGLTPAQMFANKNPECQPIDDIQLRLINGTKTTRAIASMRGFVTPQGRAAAGMKYEIPDYHGSGISAISRATGHGTDARVVVIYDKTGADLYSEDGKYILTAPPTALAKQAYIEKQPEHWAAEGHHHKRKAQMLNAAEEFASEVDRARAIAMSQMGYDVSIALGGNKESVNSEYEEALADFLEESMERRAKEKKNKSSTAQLSDDPVQRAIEQML